jgi:hypothetical protein
MWFLVCRRYAPTRSIAISVGLALVRGRGSTGPFLPLDVKGDWTMTTLGIDAHKRSHTVVALDDVGRQLATRSTTTTAGHLALVRWAERLDRGQGRELAA